MEKIPFSIIPNNILDGLSLLSLPCYSQKILIKIIRETYGFRRNSAPLSLSYLSFGCSIKDRSNVLRGLNKLISLKIVSVSKQQNKTSFYKINPDFFEKLIHNQKIKKQHLLSAQTTDVLSAQTTDVLSAQTTDVLSAQTTNKSNHLNQTNKSNHLNQTVLDVFQNLSTKEYTQDQIQKLRKTISEQIGASEDSEAVTVYLQDQITKTSRQRSVKDKFAYTLQSCRNISSDLTRGVYARSQ